MGALCCCCRDDWAYDPRPTQPQRHGGGGHRATYHAAAAASPPQQQNRCDICSRIIDPCLLDGHREACRAQHRRRMQAEQDAKKHRPPPHIEGDMGTSAEPTSIDDLPPELLCIVCMDAKKQYAFVPCGHLIGCYDCVKAMDLCPVCRTQRTGLLKLDLQKQDTICMCKHCGHVITPAFFDGHREVCSLQMRQRQRAQEAVLDATPTTGAGGSDDARTGVLHPSLPPPSPPPPLPQRAPPETVLCVHCKLRHRDTALVPCAHRVLCRECAKAVSCCPICFEQVTSMVTTYDC